MPRLNITQQQIESIPNLYESGLTLMQIAIKLNCSYWTIQKYWKKQGTKVIHAWKYKRKPMLNEQQLNNVVQDYYDNNSAAKIAKKNNVSTQYILDYLRSKNIKRKPAKCYNKGLTVLNQLIRKQPENTQWKKDVIQRDNYKCIKCWDQKELEIDHIKPMCLLIRENKITRDNFKQNINLFIDINNGRTLCKSCHKKTDTYAKQCKEYYVIGLNNSV